MSRDSAALQRAETAATAPMIRPFRVALTPAMLPGAQRLIASAVLACAAAAPALAEERLASVLFQNDLFLGHDGGGYTNGTFVSIMRVTSPGESSVEPPLLMKPIAGWLGLPEATLASSTLGQIMVTPRDITVRKPDPMDAPYIGALVFRSAQVDVHDDIADMAAINFGVVGPAAGAEQTQRFVHRVVGADRPEGWDSQVSNKVVAGIERYRAWRFPLGESEAGKANGDFVALAGGAL
ncbi:MAG: lipid A-modifier LpxR family protein, partial [Variovorax sp.]